MATTDDHGNHDDFLSVTREFPEFAEVSAIDVAGVSEPDSGVAADSLPPGSALLVVVRGPNSGASFLLDHPVTTIGRHNDADILLDDNSVSRHHAEVRIEGAEHTLVDVGSRNGTYLDNDPVDTVPLTDGDIIRIGKYRLRYSRRRPT